jgi:hypothetical protein
MLDIKGTKAIQGRSSTSDTKHVTLASTVCTSGKMLKPFLIIEGQPCGCITISHWVTWQHTLMHESMPASKTGNF